MEEVLDFQAFMKGNAIPVEERDVVVSKRFLGKDGKPAAWKIHAITPEENDAIQEQHTKMVTAPGKAGRRGQMIPRLDVGKYGAALVAACVSFPDLNNAALQDSYGAKDAIALLQQMLTPGELADLQNEVSDVCGFQTLEEQVDTAKN